MAIKIIVAGASGKMGQESVKALRHDSAFELVGEASKSDQLSDLIPQLKADVVLDFTTPAAVYSNSLAIINAGAHPVIGTTGLTKDQINDLTQRCHEKKRGAVIAPNFCIGAVLMMRFAQSAARYYPDVEIIEEHHPGKKDAPSGTALKTAEMIELQWSTWSSEHPHPALRPSSPTSGRGENHNSIPIHSVRLPGIVANQEVLFGGLGETLSIRHNTINREAFMPGVLLACKKVMDLDHLVYGLENLLS